MYNLGTFTKFCNLTLVQTLLVNAKRSSLLAPAAKSPTWPWCHCHPVARPISRGSRILRSPEVCFQFERERRRARAVVGGRVTVNHDNINARSVPFLPKFPVTPTSVQFAQTWVKEKTDQRKVSLEGKMSNQTGFNWSRGPCPLGDTEDGRTDGRTYLQLEVVRLQYIWPVSEFDPFVVGARCPTPESATGTPSSWKQKIEVINVWHHKKLNFMPTFLLTFPPI